MTTTLKFAPYGSSVAIFANTELASMASGSGTFGSGAGLTSQVWDNTTLRYPEADVVVKLGSITPGTAGFLTLALLWSPGGTDFDDPQYASGQSSSNVPLGGSPIYNKTLVGGASAKIIVFERVLLRPGKAKFLLVNNSGVTLNAASNTALMYPATYEAS